MKPYVHGLKVFDNTWFYVAECYACEWTCGWDGELSWELVVKSAAAHWWMYSDLPSHK